MPNRIDHPFDWDAATLEVVRSLTRARHLIGVMDEQHRMVEAKVDVRWVPVEIETLDTLIKQAEAKRSAYVDING